MIILNYYYELLLSLFLRQWEWGTGNPWTRWSCVRTLKGEHLSSFREVSVIFQERKKGFQCRDGGKTPPGNVLPVSLTVVELCMSSSLSCSPLWCTEYIQGIYENSLTLLPFAEYLLCAWAFAMNEEARNVMWVSACRGSRLIHSVIATSKQIIRQVSCQAGTLWHSLLFGGKPTGPGPMNQGRTRIHHPVCVQSCVL